MVKTIDIEYCGGWGYGGPATRLKKAIEAAIPGAPINLHSAKGMTSKIEVAWIDGGNKQIVWSKGKADTENGHAEIIAILKKGNWGQPLNKNEKFNLQWEGVLKVMGLL